MEGPTASRVLREGRLIGLDVARCLALLGMMATHVLDERTGTGAITPAHQLAGGRASALFAVLAGVSLALMTGDTRPVRGPERVRASVGLAARALLIAVLGLVLGGLGSGLAIILTYYGVLFLLGIPFLGLGTRTLAVLAAAWVVVVPVVSHLVRPVLPQRGFESPHLGQLDDPARLLSELLFTGYYPAVPWLAYLLAGMALGRTDLRGVRTAAALAAGGLVLAAAATVSSWWALGDPAVRAALAPDAPGTGRAELWDSMAEGLAGTTPTGAADEWLLVVAPHSGTPFDLAQTIGSALVVIGACLLLARALPQVGQATLAVLFGAGAMTLTLYSLHAVMRTPGVWPEERPETFVWHVLVVLATGSVFAALGRRGPLETVVGWPWRALRRTRT